MKKTPPKIEGTLRKNALRVPECIRQCSGIVLFGRRLKSLAFTTDLAIIRNCNADAILAVYPFTPQPVINQALLQAAEIPVFTGVGGGLTTGERVVRLASFSEMQGAVGVVVNAPTAPETIRAMVQYVEVPVVVTVVRMGDAVDEQIRAGASILNVAAAEDTPAVVRALRQRYPTLPMMASGGTTEESIMATIEAGANAITWTPLPSKEIFRSIMAAYREGKDHATP